MREGMREDIRSTVEYDIHGFDCGYGGPLRVFALVNFLQEAAGINAARQGFGMGDLQAEGRTWMLSRLDLRVDELPRDGDRVLVHTWPAGAKKLFAMRALDMRSLDGRSLVRAVYAYLIVDIAARRPLRPEGLFGPVFPGTGESFPVPDYAFTIPDAESPTIEFAQRVRARHIDHNGHANNAHILNWLADAAAPATSAVPVGVRGELAALRVEFLAEALEGDELVATRALPASSPFGSETASYSAVSTLLRGETKVARALVGLR